MCKCCSLRRGHAINSRRSATRSCAPALKFTHQADVFECTKPRPAFAWRGDPAFLLETLEKNQNYVLPPARNVVKGWEASTNYWGGVAHGTPGASCAR